MCVADEDVEEVSATMDERAEAGGPEKEASGELDEGKSCVAEANAEAEMYMALMSGVELRLAA